MDCGTAEPGIAPASGDGPDVPQPNPEERPEPEQTGAEPEIVKVEPERTGEEPERTGEELDAHMDGWGVEKGVNTDEDWEAQVMAMWEHSTQLAEQHAKLLEEQGKEEAEHQKHVQQLEKKKEEKIHQHQTLLDKLESVRVKMQLNDSKATRRKFLAKKDEMTTEKNRAEEARNRLAKELEEGERKMALLLEENAQEQQLWGKELGDLRAVLQHAKKEAEAAERKALQDEMAAVETQRDVITVHIEAWLKEVEQYLSVLRMDPAQLHRNRRREWEKRESLVRKNKAELQKRFQEVLQQLQQGHELQSLPNIQAPFLPPVPMVDLYINQIMLSLSQPAFPPPPLPPPPSASNLLLPQHQPQTLLRGPLRSTPPPNPSPSPSVTARHTIPPTSSLPSVLSSAPSHHTATTTASTHLLNPAQPPAPAITSTGKLDKLLDKLGTKFPQCTRTQLMLVLQQIKSSRGTMAGLSIEEVTEQVGLKLAQSDLPAPGPISQPTPAPAASRAFPRPHAPFHPPLGPIQGTTHLPQRAPTTQAFSRKLCLMCQNHVQSDSQYPLVCSHIIHKECISVWLQTSRNHPCPFCSSK
ncbi:RING finger protein 214 [Lampris incognitus]|uniref:RING finger protein 214 n=1 Tax=Lampris incognitus TaxID=2546036 RepID=UPI0024B54418|nr:RING finger protein 214 [Lampris incognitus]